MLDLTRLRLPRLLTRLLDTWVLLERVLLDHSGLLRWADLARAGRAHLNGGGAGHGYSWCLWRMSGILVRVNSCWAIHREALVLEMGGGRHVVRGGAGLGSHCCTLVSGGGSLLLLNGRCLGYGLLLLGSGES